MQFRKLHGAGNDFVLLTDAGLSHAWRTEAPRLCERRTGVGADGLVLSTLVDKDPAPVLEVICINADGSLASMCGNALRCVAWAAAADHGFTAMTLMMAGVSHEATVSGNHVSVTAEAGEVEPERVETWWQETRLRFDAVNTGTEHVVALVDDVDAVDVDRLGPLVRHHDALAPVGTNVNFVHPVDAHALRIRTYERGVEAETLSCGSGAVAAAVIASRRGVVAPGPVTVHNRAGTPLTVTPNGERPGSYWVAGPVAPSFRGELELL
ncbi:diaminopimelate epimerase [Actinacidiphila sp. bgisy144]|uniref:diaminopimelate epimerase n=1 Tax=Actinacidiphila sp. bgisy144 TaxID=3413791 RepID=UPI003EBDF8F0